MMSTPTRLGIWLVCAGALILPLESHAGKNIGDVSDLRIDHQRFVLDNGLTLIVHEDHKAPIVAVNVWYHVGSKDEQPGLSGFTSSMHWQPSKSDIYATRAVRMSSQTRQK